MFRYKVQFPSYGLECLSSAARALHRLLEWKNHAVPWPSHSGLNIDLLSAIIKRINEASGIYQMFGVLGDVILLQGYSVIKLFFGSVSWLQCR